MTATDSALIETVGALEDELSTPGEDLVREFSILEGPLIVLGAGGKMGPTLTRMARRALAASGAAADVIAVSRFSNAETRERLVDHGIQTISCDLLDFDAVRSLPDAANVIYMPAMKFGSTEDQSSTWAMNAFLPGLVAERYQKSRIVVFSSGNIYPFTSVESGGATEETPVGPVGEYAQSVLGRERVFEYFSNTKGTPVIMFRLNYAVELRYGVLVDIALKLRNGEPIDVTMGHCNIIWQRDANEIALRCLMHASSPPSILNVTCDAILSIRDLATQVGKRMNLEPHFTGNEADTALISNTAKSINLFGKTPTPLDTMIDRVAHWIAIGAETINKPTKFNVRDGKF
jgi:nucleoside-diphosphate-sugar epimerase